MRCLFLLLIVLSGRVEGQSASECKWPNGLSSQLGIEADSSNQNNNRLQIFYAIVLDDEKINAAGLFVRRKGDSVKIL